MLHTVLDLHSTQLVNSITQLNVKLVKKKLKKEIKSPFSKFFFLQNLYNRLLSK